MLTRQQWRDLAASRPMRTSLFVLGLLLMAAAPVLGPIPGPGGIIVFAAGLSLALKNSDWAKRRYVRFKRQQPKAGRWADWGLRRPSARRREALRKEQERADAPPAGEEDVAAHLTPQPGMEVAPTDPSPAELQPSRPIPEPASSDHER